MNALIIPCTHCGAKNRIPADKQHLGPKCGKCKEILTVKDRAVCVELSDQEFDGFMRQVQLPVLLDFYSPTCGPCRMMAPVLDRLCRKFYGKVVIVKIDTSKNSMVASRHNIRGVPTFVIFSGGKVVDQVVGAVPESVLESKLAGL